MEKITLPLFFFLFLFKSVSGADDCRPSSCSHAGPQVRFPFRIRGRQPSRCGFPGFDLSCNKRNRTILHLTSSRSYIVNKISYASQVFSSIKSLICAKSEVSDEIDSRFTIHDPQLIYVDPEFCRPKRIADFSLAGTPFDFTSLRSYTFYNCSSQKFGYIFPAVPFPCLGGGNYSVIAVRSGLIPAGETPENCEDIAMVSVPIRWYGDVREELELMWLTPFCRPCETEGRICGLKSDAGETACFGSSAGISRNAKYGLSIGMGVSILICIIALVCYTATSARDYNQSIDLYSITLAPQTHSSTGLDMPTIESYTKIVLGESRRLPKDDETCPICLSDYKPKEALRTIPECNHYFHVDCIDEWLRLNATCPMCRNSPEKFIIGYNASSMSTF